MKNAIILILFTGFIFFIGWWISDESLNPVAQHWIEEPVKESKAYNLLLGIGSEPGLSAEEEGRRLFYARLKDPTVAIPNHFGRQVSPDLLCDYANYSCLANQRKHVDAIPAILRDYQTLIERYQQLITMDRYVDNTPLNLTVDFPRYALLLEASRLSSLQLLTQPNIASALATEIKHIRHFLGQEHNLISKLVTARILAEKIQFASLLVQEGTPVALADYRLSIEEKSLATALRYEFLLRARFLIDEQYKQGISEMTIWERLALALGTRTNITLNRDLASTLHYADLSENPAVIIVNDHYVMPPPTTGQTIRNPFGNYLLEIATQDMKSYLLRMAHLDAKLQLLGWLRHPDQALPNPWPESAPIVIDKEKQQICFPTSQNSDQQNSCLPWLPSP